MGALVEIEVQGLVVKTVRILEGGAKPGRIFHLGRPCLIPLAVDGDLLTGVPSVGEIHTGRSVEGALPVDKHGYLRGGDACGHGVIAHLDVVGTGFLHVHTIGDAAFLVLPDDYIGFALVVTLGHAGIAFPLVVVVDARYIHTGHIRPLDLFLVVLRVGFLLDIGDLRNHIFHFRKDLCRILRTDSCGEQGRTDHQCCQAGQHSLSCYLQGTRPPFLLKIEEHRQNAIKRRAAFTG